jgi:anti-sigma B factor antagonist
VVSFQGDLDLQSSPEARRVLLECVDRSKNILVDLSAVPYLDSSGVASLVEAYQLSRSRGITFGLVSVSPRALRVLELSVSPRALRVLELARLDKVFAIHSSLDASDGD